MSFESIFPYFNKLPLNSQRALIQNSSLVHYKKGALISQSQNECTGLLLVKNGQLRVYTLSDEGKEVTLYRLFDYDLCLFSASCIISSLQFDLFIEAQKDTDVYIIPANIYQQLMKEDLVIASLTNETMASRFTEVMGIIDSILFKSLDKRIARFLIEESELEETNTLKITHDMMANHLGTAREVVTRLLRYFQNEGYITLKRGTITILKPEELENLY